MLDLKLGARNSYTIEEQNSDVIEIWCVSGLLVFTLDIVEEKFWSRDSSIIYLLVEQDNWERDINRFLLELS